MLLDIIADYKKKQDALQKELNMEKSRKSYRDDDYDYYDDDDW